VQDCAACFVSGDPLGRLSASILGQLPEGATATLARGSDYHLPHPLAPLNPYWRQIRLMRERLRILGPLRQKINLVLTPTTFTRDAFVANGFDAANVELLPFAVDADHPLGRVTKVPSEHIRFLFVGRLQPYKGAHLLLEAFDRLARPQGATLTIYGAAGAEYEDYFRRLQRVMAQNDRIDFRGTIAPERLGEAFSRADYFILPSTWHENSPLILLDALQSKTPVIASNIGGVTDAVEHEGNGLLFPMGDIEALRQTLQRTIDEPELAARLSAAVELPLIEDYAQRLIDLCRERELFPEPSVAGA
jgi:glycosyltransferase involved in cell wall biosynthesis